jgi:hypothetical protein
MGPDAFSQELDPQLSTQLGGGRQGRRETAFTTRQMEMMVRNHAFSSGYQSYNSFIRKGTQTRRSRTIRGSEEDMSAEKKSPSAFGIELLMDGDAEAWERSCQQQSRGMGRSSSEGALLNFGLNTVDQMTRRVQNDLRININDTSLEKIRRPSFPAKLDVLPVSPEPHNPMSATGQAVRKMQKVESQRMLPPLQTAGQMAVMAEEQREQRGAGKGGPERFFYDKSSYTGSRR